MSQNIFIGFKNENLAKDPYSRNKMVWAKNNKLSARKIISAGRVRVQVLAKAICLHFA